MEFVGRPLASYTLSSLQSNSLDSCVQSLAVLHVARNFTFRKKQPTVLVSFLNSLRSFWTFLLEIKGKAMGEEVTHSAIC